MNKKITDDKLVLYRSKDGSIQLEASLEQETIWLSLNQLANLFERDKSVISRHLKNIYDTKELSKKATLEDISKQKVATYLKEAKISITDFSLKDVLTSLNVIEGASIKNAGILFFDKDPRRKISQCQMTCVAYKGIKGVHVYDRIDIQDDLLTQFNQAMMFLRKHLNVRSEIKEVNRHDIYEIPLDALREAIANAIIHRDYGVYGTSLMVEVHENRVDIYNPGKLPQGVDIQSLMQVSMRRNELIADLFARIDKAERLGSGLRRVFEIMEAADLEPPVIENNLFFRISFKRPFYAEIPREMPHETVKKVADIKLDETAKAILNEIEKRPYIRACPIWVKFWGRAA